MQEGKTNKEVKGNVITLDIENSFNAAKLRLSALLDALSSVIIEGRAGDKHGETAYSLVDMAEDYAEEMNSIFERITEEGRNSKG